MFDFFANHQVVEGDYSLEQIRVEQELGRGNAHVYTAFIRREACALKQIEIRTDYEYQSFLKEVAFMRELSRDCAWFIQYKGYLVTRVDRNQYDRRKYAFIVMECAEENMEQFLTQRRSVQHRLKVPDLEVLLPQMLSALAALEERHIAHCDIKPENILVMDTSRLTVKLCDVGSCRVVSKENLEEGTILGTVPFLAPQLIRPKGQSSSHSPFKADVFSFGLVLLYMVTLKKFKSHERLQADQQTYRQVIQQWVKQAKELCNFEPLVTQILKYSLDFDQFKRPMFRDLKFTCFNQIKKRSILYEEWINRMSKQDEARMPRVAEVTFQSVPSNQLNLFKSRKIDRPFNKTTSNTFKISRTRNTSPSPVKRTLSCVSSSPQKNQQQSLQTHGLRKVVYITEDTRSLLPEDLGLEYQKIFVLTIPLIRFRKAQSVTVMPECTFDVFEQLQDVQSKRLFLQCTKQGCLGLPKTGCNLHFAKIRANFTRCQLVGGFQGIFKSMAHEGLQLIEVQLTESEVSFDEVIGLLDRLGSECPNLQTFLLSWERRILSEEQHFEITERVARLPLKKLTLIMNQNYIKYQTATRWALPKNCQILYLEYSDNLLSSIVNNLCISLSSSSLKQLYLNLSNNNLAKGEVHMLIKCVAGLKTLDRLLLNLAHSKIEEINYLQKNLLDLLTLSYLDLRLHHTDIPLKALFHLLKELQPLFDFGLRVFRVTATRSAPLPVLRQLLQQKLAPDGRLKCDIIGSDNEHFTVFIRKKDKGHSTRSKPIKKPPKPQITGRTLGPQSTMNGFGSNVKSISLCSQFYSPIDGFNNYLCVTCCEDHQTSKYMHYCRFCMSNCAHRYLKDHYFIRVVQRTICACAYSGNCSSDVHPMLCADHFAPQLKKQYNCWKCMLRFCIVCVRSCKMSHPNWVKETKELAYFKCRSKIIK